MIKKLLTSAFFIAANAMSAQVTSGLVASYSFNNGNANDEAGAATGTVMGATLVSDRFGNTNKAYSFSGSAYIDCGNTTAIKSMTTAYSISAWFKRSSASTGFEVIAAKWNTTPVSEHFFLATNGNKVAWACAGPGNAGTNDPTGFNLNTWVHVVFTWSSNGEHKVYINNTLSTSANLGTYTINATVPVNFLIGAQSPTSRQFNGSIDDVKIYNRAITAAEVTTLYNEANPATVGLSETSLNLKEIRVFPNPASEQVTITGTHNQAVEITNELGQLVKTIELNGENGFKADVSTLSPGIYIISSGTFKKKLLVQNN